MKFTFTVISSFITLAHETLSIIGKRDLKNFNAKTLKGLLCTIRSRLPISFVFEVVPTVFKSNYLVNISTIAAFTSALMVVKFPSRFTFLVKLRHSFWHFVASCMKLYRFFSSSREIPGEYSNTSVVLLLQSSANGWYRN